VSLAENLKTASDDLPPLDMSDIPQHLWHLLPLPGMVIDIWKPELTAEGWEQVRLALEEIERQR
jgi:hypothetical protein